MIKGNEPVLLLLLFASLFVGYTYADNHEVWVDKEIYQVWYNESLEQPTKVTYWVNNRPNNVDRKGMNLIPFEDYLKLCNDKT